MVMGGGAIGVLGFMGFRLASHFLPRPPRKVLVKEKVLPAPGGVKVGDGYFLVRLSGGQLLVLSRRCPHLGCTVNYQPSQNIFLCPCHQSRFALNGAYLSGPAPRGLYELRWEKTESGLILEIPG